MTWTKSFSSSIFLKTESVLDSQLFNGTRLVSDTAHNVYLVNENWKFIEIPHKTQTSLVLSCVNVYSSNIEQMCIIWHRCRAWSQGCSLPLILSCVSSGGPAVLQASGWSSSHCSLLKCLQSSCCSGLLSHSIPLQQQGGISIVPRPIDFHAEQLLALKVLRLLRVFLSSLIKAVYFIPLSKPYA